MGNENNIFKEAEEYRSYFLDDEKKIDEIYENLNNIENKLTNIINLFIENPGMRGTQKTLSDQIANFISIQNQKQSLAKDKRSIKENALTIALKQNSNEGNDDEKTAIINKMIALVKNKSIEETKNTSNEDDINIDEKIKKKLGK